MLCSTPTSRLCDVLVAAAIFCACLALFLHSPVSYVGDSKYTLLLSQTLLSKHSFMLDDYAGPPGNLAPSPQYPLSQRPYQVETSRDGHVYCYLPPGSSVLAAPFLFVGDLLGKGVLRKDGTYDLFQEEKDQLFIAALLMAGLAVIFYRTSRLVLPPAWSATIALGGALGTQIWSTSTRSLCSQTWACLLLGYAVYLLFAHEIGLRRLRPAWLATALSWAYFVRPTSSIAIGGITIYLLLFHRRTFLSYAVTGAAWGAGFVLYSLYHFGTFLPAYYAASRLQPETFWEALAGNLISPGRGVLVFVPVTLFVGYLVMRFWREQCHPGLIWLGASISVAQVLAVSGFPHWWGGICFGARFTTELVPWLVLMAALGVAAARRWRENAIFPRQMFAWKVTLAAGGALLLLSAWINARGANAGETYFWNIQPLFVDQYPARLWDWRYPQVLAGIVEPPVPEHFPVLPVGEKVSFGCGESSKYRLGGWRDCEPTQVWTDARWASIIFATDVRRINTLRLFFSPFLYGKQVTRQRVKIRLNGRRIATLDIHDPAQKEYSLAIPPGVLREKNYLTFELPNVVPLFDLVATTDTRALGIGFGWIQLVGPSAPGPVSK
jgi:hypothetical protein